MGTDESKSKPSSKVPQAADTETRLAATDEILQVMYWLRGEKIALEVGPDDLAKWLGIAGWRIGPLMTQLLGARLVDRVVVDSGIDEGVPRFRLTRAGIEEGRRRFTDEFADFTKPRHFEHSDPACDCEDVARFSVSLKKSLFRQLDEMIEEKGYENRSLAISDMIRSHLVDHWQEVGELSAVGTIMLAYDPHDAQTSAALADLQEQHLAAIISTLRVQVEQGSWIEILVVRGLAPELKALSDRLIGTKGVKHGKLSLTVTPDDLAG